ncbi:MAG: L,D-transpeptidase family protein [Desulfovibrio sp.]|nr:L,D-transpeptidase family protein [Desulfovibrio sp.]MBI4959504.1 L,D-transpeptidase family protein [Desulfovibrio sp.]
MTAWSTRFVFVLATLLAFACDTACAQTNPASQSNQVLLVLTDGWETRNAQMRLFERTPGKTWKAVGPPIPVMLGKNGMGWGAGLHSDTGPGPVKREGDGKAPAGIFLLGPAFGTAPASKRALKIPYTQMTAAYECVDDAASQHYNQVLDTSTLASKGWTSSEQMRRLDHQYDLGVVVAHNATPPVPNGGSCIFLHIWRTPDSYTSGCTAMSRENMERVAAWLDAKKTPLLVQLPKDEHERFSKAYGLP